MLFHFPIKSSLCAKTPILTLINFVQGVCHHQQAVLEETGNCKVYRGTVTNTNACHIPATSISPGVRMVHVRTKSQCTPYSMAVVGQVGVLQMCLQAETGLLQLERVGL